MTTNPHITIADIVPKVQTIADGVQTVFPFGFPIFNDDDIRVLFDGVAQTTGYAVAGAGESDGGSVTFNTAPTSGVIVTIERRLDLERLTDLFEGGSFSSKTLNDEFDYLMACVQQVANDQLSGLKFDDTEPVTISDTILPKKSLRANKALGFDGDGVPTMLETTPVAAPSFTATGTGAATRSLTDKAREAVSVKDFGAVGDGVTDDTAAITAALAAHDAVFVPEGSYVVTSAVVLSSDKTLIGAGSAAILKGNSTATDILHIEGEKNTVSTLGFEGGNRAILFTAAASGSTACRLNTVSDVTMTTPQTGIEIDGGADVLKPADWNTITGVKINGPAVNGIHLSRTGAGRQPQSNRFAQIDINSDAVATSGHGIYVQSGRYLNSFTDVVMTIDPAATACIRIGAEAYKTALMNITTESSSLTPNIQLDSGSDETAIVNLHSGSDGAAILDNSGGNYIAVNAGSPDTTRLRRTRVTDLRVERANYVLETVTNAGTTDITLGRTAYQVDATAGDATMRLPEAVSDNEGALVHIKKIDNSGNDVIITELNATGPEGRELRMQGQYDMVQLMSNGAQWLIVGGNMAPNNTKYLDTTGTVAIDAGVPVHLLSASGGAITAQLPPANADESTGRIVTIKKVDSSGNAVTVTESGASGPDNSSQALGSQYHAVTVISDGSSWHILARQP